jgi:Cu/Ag efflux pump CusA
MALGKRRQHAKQTSMWVATQDLVPFDEQPRLIIRAARQVARAIFFSLAIIVISFVPVFLLEAQEGRMVRPLALMKTFAMVGASILAITLVPVLMRLIIRGSRLRPESRNPISRAFIRIYDPIIRLALRWRWTALLVNLAFVPLKSSGTVNDMPTSLRAVDHRGHASAAGTGQDAPEVSRG